MRFIAKFLKFVLRWVAEVFKLAITAAIGLWFGCLLLTSGWYYALVDGQEKRCWSVRLPGVEEYTDWEHGEPTIRRIFSMRAHYRLGPWIDPEWVEHSEDTAPLPAEEPEE